MSRWTPLLVPLVLAAVLAAGGLGTPASSQAGSSQPGEDRSGDADGEASGGRWTVHGPLAVSTQNGVVERARVHGPGGAVLVDLVTGGPGVGQMTVAGRSWHVSSVQAELRGDPFTDEEVYLVVQADGASHEIRVEPGIEGPFATIQNASAPLVVLESPLAPGSVHLTVNAGPVLLEAPGTIAARFDLAVRVAVDNATGDEHGALLLDGVRGAELEAQGVQDAATVFLGSLPAWRLPAQDGAQVALEAELVRQLAPGLMHRQVVAGLDLELDTLPPQAPTPRVEEGRLVWAPVPEAAAYEAAVGPPEGPARPLAVENTSARLPGGDGPWQARVRAVDAVGNPGPWSPVVNWTPPAPGPAPEAPTLDLVAPGAGMRVQGPVELSWAPDPSIGVVRLAASLDAGASWRQIGEAAAPPLVWDSRLVPDGTYLLKVTAEGPGGTTSRLVPGVVVDNLEPLSPEAAGSGGTPASGAGSELPPPDPGSPLPLALTAFLLLFATGVSLVAWMRWRRQPRR